MINLKFNRYPIRNFEFAIKANNFIRRASLEFDLIHDNTNSIISAKLPVLNMVHYYALMEEKYWGHACFLDTTARIAIRCLAKLESVVFEKSNFLMSPSQCTSNNLAMTLRNKQKVAVNYYGIDTALFTPKPSIEKKHDLLFVGRVVPRKGISILLEALARIKNKKLKVMICAIKGRSWGLLLKYARKSHHNISIVEQTPYSQLPNYYNQAHLTVFPSLYETFGFVIGESLSSGTPVLAFNLAANPEIIQNGETGFLCSPYTAGKLAESILQLLENKENLSKVGKKGRERIIADFSWERHVRETFKGYLEICH